MSGAVATSPVLAALRARGQRLAEAAAARWERRWSGPGLLQRRQGGRGQLADVQMLWPDIDPGRGDG